MSEMSLEEQIRCMKEMRSYLGDFCKIMQHEMDTMKSQIDFLRSQGFSTETEQSYTQRYYNPAKNDVDQVVSHIYGHHFDFIDEVVEYLERAKNR